MNDDSTKLNFSFAKGLEENACCYENVKRSRAQVH